MPAAFDPRTLQCRDRGCHNMTQCTDYDMTLLGLLCLGVAWYSEWHHHSVCWDATFLLFMISYTFPRVRLEECIQVMRLNGAKPHVESTS